MRRNDTGGAAQRRPQTRQPKTTPAQPDALAGVLRAQLTELNLPFIREHCH